MHPRLDSILELCQTFPFDEAGKVSTARMNIHYLDYIKKLLTPQLSIDPTCTYRQVILKLHAYQKKLAQLNIYLTPVKTQLLQYNLI